MTNDALIEEINAAYRRLDVATEELASADRELAEHVRKIRLDNAEAVWRPQKRENSQPLPRRPARH